MKRFLKNVFSILKRTNEAKCAKAPKGPSPTPSLEVRSQVKAGLQPFSWGGVTSD